MVLVFGSINVDGVLSAPRLPMVGETVVGAGYTELPGGKGANQAVAAARAGAQVRMAGCVGRDQHGREARAALLAAEVDVELVAESDRATGFAAVCVDPSGQNQIIVASGANELVHHGQVPDTTLASAALVVLQLEVPLAENQRIAERSARQGARVVLNAAPFTPLPEMLLRHVDVLAVNEVEAAGLAEHLGERDDSILRVARRLARHYELAVALTLGARGACLVEKNDAWHIERLPVAVVDTTGAGDAFVGAFAAAVDRGDSWLRALETGNVAGGLACQALGAQAALPDRPAIDAALAEGPRARAIGEL